MFALTDEMIEVFENDGSRDFFMRDAHLRGFGAKITKQNKKSFFVESRVPGSIGSAKRLTIGYFPNMSVSAARKEAGRILDLMRGGTQLDCISRRVDLTRSRYRREANRDCSP